MSRFGVFAAERPDEGGGAPLPGSGQQPAAEVPDQEESFRCSASHQRQAEAVDRRWAGGPVEEIP